jgi:2-polyprenyl-6-methoxyphenol hydroxylase-like FAD-dependent oxidoreductase
VSSSEHVDVAIIGAGIAGSALATALTDSGFSVHLIDRSDEPLDTARGDHIQPAMAPILSRWGIWDGLLEAGGEKRFGTRWFDASHEHIVTIPVPEHAECAPWFLFLNHEDIGRVLRDRAIHNGAKCTLGAKRWTLTRAKACWHLSWESSQGTEAISCSMLVGADGTGSSVRSRLDIDIRRHRYQYPIAVLYGRQRTVPDKRTLDVHLTQDRMLSLIPRTGGGTKIGFPIAVEELALLRDAPEPHLHKQLGEWCPTLDFETLTFGAIYPPVSQQSEPYQGEGAVVLIGDARHAMHPARSMGMNTCFRVADQLARMISEVSPGFSEQQVLPILQQFDRQFASNLAPILADNHAAGLQMDTISGNGFAELTGQLRAASSRANVMEAMGLKAAGLVV